MLKLESLSCGYGDMIAVHGISLIVPNGCITALLGANGAGKTSTIMCIAGHVAVKKGRILFEERDITHLTPMERVKLGISVVPEGRRLFPRLSVKENLIVGGYSRPGKETPKAIERVVSLFPRLGERMGQQAGSLSGGEQQMLAIGRALMPNPKLIMIDELSLGLMPKVIDTCYDAIRNLNQSGLTVVLVEQSTKRALETAHDVLVLESGNTVWQGKAMNAAEDSALIDRFLGLESA